MTGIVELLKEQAATYGDTSGSWIDGMDATDRDFVNDLFYSGSMKGEKGSKAKAVLKHYTDDELVAAYAKFKVEREV